MSKMLEKQRIMKIAGINTGLLTEIEYKKLDMPISEAVMLIFNAFKKHGFKLYIVGGAVRDALLNKIPHDYDLVSEATPDQIMNLLTQEGIYTFGSGKQFWVVSAVIDNVQYEIATFRVEKYSKEKGRKPEVFAGNMQTDVMRRDLTINALYYDIEAKTVIDLVGGIEDLKNGQVRAVGDPEERFEQDSLRVMRMIRFAHRFGRPLDANSIAAIKKFWNMPGTSTERIFQEFNKGLESAKKPEAYLLDLINYNIIHRMLPNLNLNTHLIPGLRNPVLVVANLVSGNNLKQIYKVLLDSKFDGNIRNSIIFLEIIKQRFSHFDRLVFDPSIDGAWFIDLVKKGGKIDVIMQYGVIQKSDVIKWAEINAMDTHVISKLMDFKPVFSNKDFPDKTGIELGKAIEIANAHLFINSL